MMIQCCMCTYCMGSMQLWHVAHMHMNQYHGFPHPPNKSMQPCASLPPLPVVLCVVCHTNVCPCLPLMEIGVSWLVYTRSWCLRINGGVFLCNYLDVSGIKSWVQCFVVRRGLNVTSPSGDVGMIDSLYAFFSVDPVDWFSLYVSFDLQSDFLSRVHDEGNNPVLSFCLFLIVFNLSQFES